jgi:hypothetical protein
MAIAERLTKAVPFMSTRVDMAEGDAAPSRAKLPPRMPENAFGAVQATHPAGEP